MAPANTPVVCVQNGVENERVTLRRFGNVYGIPVMCPTLHLECLRVSPALPGILDIGRWPRGRGEVVDQLAAAPESSTFSSRPLDDVARWKWGSCNEPRQRHRGPVGTEARAR